MFEYLSSIAGRRITPQYAFVVTVCLFPVLTFKTFSTFHLFYYPVADNLLVKAMASATNVSSITDIGKTGGNTEVKYGNIDIGNTNTFKGNISTWMRDTITGTEYNKTQKGNSSNGIGNTIIETEDTKTNNGNISTYVEDTDTNKENSTTQNGNIRIDIGATIGDIGKTNTHNENVSTKIETTVADNIKIRTQNGNENSDVVSIITDKVNASTDNGNISTGIGNTYSGNTFSSDTGYNIINKTNPHNGNLSADIQIKDNTSHAEIPASSTVLNKMTMARDIINSTNIKNYGGNYSKNMENFGKVIEKEVVVNNENKPHQNNALNENTTGMSGKDDTSSFNISTPYGKAIVTFQKKIEDMLMLFSWDNHTETNLKPGDLHPSNLPKIWNMVPIKFQNSFKNPCWNEFNATLGHMTLRCLPYFFLAGFPKCGTTDLYFRLGKHREISLSNDKERHWWTRRRLYGESFDSYLGYFIPSSDRIQSCQAYKPAANGSVNLCISVDASVSTIWDNRWWRKDPNNLGYSEPRVLALHYLQTLLPNAKFIIIMRDPVERLYSDYLYFDVENRTTPYTFHQHILEALEKYLNCLKTDSIRACTYHSGGKIQTAVRFYIGLYYIFLKDAFEIFPKEQVLALPLSDYSRNPHTVLNIISNFLDIAEFSNRTLTNVDKVPMANTRKEENYKKGKMLPETRKLLKTFYAPFNKKLSQLLNNEKFLFES